MLTDLSHPNLNKNDESFSLNEPPVNAKYMELLIKYPLDYNKESRIYY